MKKVNTLFSIFLIFSLVNCTGVVPKLVVQSSENISASQSPVASVSPVSSAASSFTAASPSPTAIIPSSTSTPATIIPVPTATPRSSAGTQILPTAAVSPGPTPVPTVTPSSALTIAAIQPIIQNRCVTCHGGSGGVFLDTEAKIRAKLDRIKQRVVIEKSMPQNNFTNMTQQERDLIGQWIDSGAP